MSKCRLDLRPRRQFQGYMERAQRWACMVVHRRAGKTYCCVQDLLRRMLGHRRAGPPLRYAYVAPTRDQAKDIAWGYVKGFCAGLSGVRIHESDLQVTMGNGATLRLYSGESYERMRGLYFDGIVMDEPADIDPAAWHSVLRPCLSDYQGWATFIGTPKGRNQFWQLWQEAVGKDEWFSLLLKASESGILKPEEIADIRRGTPEHVYEQEFECSFAVGRPGAIYARALEALRGERRIGDDVQWYKELPVYTSFDVGAAQNQKAWIWQLVGDRVNFLEALSGDHECSTPADWAARLRMKRYAYGAHFLPHDACAAHGGLWQSSLQTAGLSHIVPVPRQANVWDGINLALSGLPRASFHAAACADGLQALDAYHARENRDGVTIMDVPVHDWSSHFADAFSLAFQAIHRGLAVDRAAMARPARRSAKPVVRMGLSGR